MCGERWSRTGFQRQKDVSSNLSSVTYLLNDISLATPETVKGRPGSHVGSGLGTVRPPLGSTALPNLPHLPPQSCHLASMV